MHLIFAFHILDSVLTKDIHLFNCFLLYFAHSRPFPLPPPFLQRSHRKEEEEKESKCCRWWFCITDKDRRCLHLCTDLDLLIQSWTPDLRRETYVERKWKDGTQTLTLFLRNAHAATAAASVKSNLKFPKPRLCCRVWANISYLRMSLSLTERRANLMASSKWSRRISGTGSKSSSC